jgi:hypothetical protein
MFGGWLKSYQTNLRKLGMPRADMDAYRRRVEQITNEHGVTLAYSATSSSTFCGFACAHDGVLEYAYVPSEMRAMGLGRAVIERVLGGYPGRIVCRAPWPFKGSDRFIYEPVKVAA